MPSFTLSHPALLSLISPLLDYYDIVKLAKLSGDSALAAMMTSVGGVKELRMKKQASICSWWLNPALLLSFRGLTCLDIFFSLTFTSYVEFRTVLHALAPTLQELSLRDENALELLLSDDPVPADLQFATHNGRLPWNIQKSQPNLRLLHVTGDSGDFWPETALQYLFQHLPLSLGDLFIDLPQSSAQCLLGPDFPAGMAQSLNRLQIVYSYPSEQYDDTYFTRESNSTSIVKQEGLPKKRQTPILEELSQLSSLLNIDLDAMPAFAQLHQLEYLESLIMSTSRLWKVGTELTMPKNLQALQLWSNPARFDFDTLFGCLPSLTRLELLALPFHVRDTMVTLNVLPPKLSYLYIHDHFHSLTLRAPLPATLTYARLHLPAHLEEIAINLQGLSSLQTLIINFNHSSTEEFLTALPWSLTSLTLASALIPENFRHLPPHLRELDCVVMLSEKQGEEIMKTQQKNVPYMLSPSLKAWILRQCNLTHLTAQNLTVQVDNKSRERFWNRFLRKPEFRNYIQLPSEPYPKEDEPISSRDLNSPRDLPQNRQTIVLPHVFWNESLSAADSEDHRDDNALYTVNTKDKGHYLPKNLVTLTVPQPTVVRDAKQEEKVLIYPLIDTTGKRCTLTTLSLQDVLTPWLEFVNFLPESITDLSMSAHGKISFDRALPITKPWLPALQRLRIEGFWLPLVCVIEILDKMSLFEVDSILVEDQLMPSLSKMDVFSVHTFSCLCLIHLIPPKHRRGEAPNFLPHSAEDSYRMLLNKLPPTIKKVKLREHRHSLFLMPSLIESLPPLLTSFDIHMVHNPLKHRFISGTLPQSLQELKITGQVSSDFLQSLPSSLTSLDLTIPIFGSIAMKDIGKLPNGLTSLRIKNEGEMHAIWTIPIAKSLNTDAARCALLPPNLVTLFLSEYMFISPWNPDNTELIDLLSARLPKLAIFSSGSMTLTVFSRKM